MRGHTLVELTFVLLLVGVAISSLGPSAARARDRAAVAAAREVLVGFLAEARQAAIETGAGSVRLSADSVTIEATSATRTLRRASLWLEFGVTLSVAGTTGDVELRYDRLGLGRMASQTLTLARGQERATLVVSSYGRVRRQ